MARSDLGSSTLTTVLLTPVFVAIAFMAFQAAMWSHARAETRSVARDTAVLIARQGVPPGIAQQSAESVLGDSLLTNADVTVDTDTNAVVVTIVGDAPGMLRWTSVDVEVVEALPIEGFRP